MFFISTYPYIEGVCSIFFLMGCASKKVRRPVVGSFKFLLFPSKNPFPVSGSVSWILVFFYLNPEHYHVVI